jgi:hypothetical protein
MVNTLQICTIGQFKKGLPAEKMADKWKNRQGKKECLADVYDIKDLKLCSSE